ncbi:hypothetical protein FN846DRAFT_132251 [Sphaerosporella brunnea]|uniref:Uncharacterized protein n=1 Tax=Sphaerosporella brunnea TaxID=1250544 RepID=A0A5J5F919_9PEZI|nr:hypothetical protein FN846DRAFT_132251 [Sphaerosporella brunnea]
MNAATFVFIFTFLFFSKLIAALPNGEYIDPGTTSIETESGTLYTTASGFKYLELRAGFDTSHPALDINNLMRLHAENKPLPRLPGVPYDTDISPQMISKGELHCETSGGSPLSKDVDMVANALLAIGKKGVYCCHKQQGKNCSPVWWQGTAISDVCNFKKKQICIHCTIAGQAVKEIASKCNSNESKAGGFVRFGSLFGTVGDVNAYHQ